MELRLQLLLPLRLIDMTKQRNWRDFIKVPAWHLPRGASCASEGSGGSGVHLLGSMIGEAPCDWCHSHEWNWPTPITILQNRLCLLGVVFHEPSLVPRIHGSAKAGRTEEPWASRIDLLSGAKSVLTWWVNIPAGCLSNPRFQRLHSSSLIFYHKSQCFCISLKVQFP